ncbi:hypothetical protein [Solimonas terrae]|uniref:Uncharacterized protein n=1 Tax=Solimonas terrae TaxID=1396819 RepID=A0A6M2BU73_9GAMM|nr:hypothetical protein [Solimonas terrae]NGY05761.1 hypothetical protein [Solimonas terrae]
MFMVAILCGGGAALYAAAVIARMPDAAQDLRDRPGLADTGGPNPA